MIRFQTWAILMAAIGTGCAGGFKPPKQIVAPHAEVQSVQVVEKGPAATRLVLHVSVTNPNDTELPLTDADYRITVGRRTYQTTTEPNVTVPAEGQVHFKLPAVLKGAPPRGDWSVRGSLEYNPLRTFEGLLLGWFRGRPRTELVGSGRIQGAGDG